jgi:hypothetical protein
MTQPSSPDIYVYRPRMSLDMSDTKDARIVAILEGLPSDDKSAFVHELLRQIISVDEAAVERLVAQITMTLRHRPRVKRGRQRSEATRSKIAALQSTDVVIRAALKVSNTAVVPVAVVAVSQNIIEVAPEPRAVAEVSENSLSRFVSSGLLGDSKW